MCFLGEGGLVDFERATTILENYIENNHNNAEAYYLLGELYLLDYYDGKDPKFREKAESVFKHAHELGFTKAGVALEILSEEGQMPRVEQNLVDHQEQLAKQFEELRIKEELSFDDCFKIRQLLPKLAAEIQEQALARLVAHYSATPNGVEKLITTLCYEGLRYPETSEECQNLKKIIVALDPKFAGYTLKMFESDIKRKEEEAGTHFDENWSGDSDSEDEKTFHASKNHVTKGRGNVDELTHKINSALLKKLKELDQIQDLDESNYKKEVKSIMELFLEATVFQPKRPAKTPAEAAKFKPEESNNKKRVIDDLNTVNHYAARGELHIALKLIKTQFCLAQTRGLHFKTTLWNQKTRRLYRKLVTAGDHPFRNKPVYSYAVYKQAGITDFNDLTEKTQLKLEQQARVIYRRLRKFQVQAPYTVADLEGLDEAIQRKLLRRKFATRGDQVQELYTNDYDGFHQFLKWEHLQQQATFLNAENPKVSTGDLQSSHAFRYGYGNKPYAKHQHERLRPCYDNDGKAHRPYSGAILLTIHPLDDYARLDHSHIVSKNIKGELIVSSLIFPERECSFESAIQADRQRFIHVAKFPSFHREKPHKIAYRKYGISEEAYTLFRKIIRGNKPHSFAQRLAIFLLGEYLSAFQTLYLTRYAYEHAVKTNKILLYRDKYGNFSLTPTYDLSPTPPGDDEAYRLRRRHTKKLREQLKFDVAQEDSDEEDAVPMPMVAPQSSLEHDEANDGDDEAEAEAEAEADVAHEENDKALDAEDDEILDFNDGAQAADEEPILVETPAKRMRPADHLERVSEREVSRSSYAAIQSALPTPPKASTAKRRLVPAEEVIPTVSAEPASAAKRPKAGDAFLKKPSNAPARLPQVPPARTTNKSKKKPTSAPDEPHAASSPSSSK
jgi:hypothetical protein